MNYKADITVKEDPDKIYKCLLPEKISRERSTFEIKKSKCSITLKIGAKDAVAFRATMNAVLQALAVYSKMKELGGKNVKRD
ncbi:hypothetical protein JW707_00425 [Candidatus Woesearchaeota archaeon]|nr:hypothetical protein [Candidatus Woesearchaeota archaeon]